LVPFPYYDRLSARDQATYRKSDAVPTVKLPGAREMQPLVAELREELARGERPEIERLAQAIASGVTDALGIPRVRVQVLAVRPSRNWGELHGLYTAEEGSVPRIQVWMRTAHHKRVVAFRTFLRTLLHELGHHIDFAHLKLRESFHTEGFFKRESSLFRQLVPEQRQGG
jgi:hypothetical protein